MDSFQEPDHKNEESEFNTVTTEIWHDTDCATGPVVCQRLLVAPTGVDDARDHPLNARIVGAERLHTVTNGNLLKLLTCNRAEKCVAAT